MKGDKQRDKRRYIITNKEVKADKQTNKRKADKELKGDKHTYKRRQ